MNATEFAFLAVGLLLGIAIGAAIAELLRARPTDRREVRVTVAPDAVARRRAATLAGEVIDRSPAAGGPAAPATLEPVGAGPASSAVPAAADARADSAAPDAIGRLDPERNRTAVPIGRTTPGEVGERAAATASLPGSLDAPPPPGDSPDVTTAAATGFRAGATAAFDTPAATATATAGVEVDEAGPGIVGATRREPGGPEVAGSGTGTDWSARSGRPRRPGTTGGPIDLPAAAVGIPIGEAPRAPGAPASERPAARAEEAVGAAPAPGPTAGLPRDVDAGQAPWPGTAEGVAGGPVAGVPPESAEACDEERRVASERCALAEAARSQAGAAAEALRLARRTYDDLRTRLDLAEAAADPRTLRAAKDAAHETFRMARAAALDREHQEGAAREWLNEINRLNHAAREAAVVIERDGAELRALAPRLDRLAIEADAARISLETADVACREAREALARCEEAAAARAAAGEVPAAEEAAWPTEGEVPFSGHPPDGGGEVPNVVRLLRGDRVARDRVVAAVAGDPEETRRWRLRLAGLVDAIVARAIEDGMIDLPEGNPFWAAFTHGERRDIAAALSALGFRFDGLGNFADGRVPGQRDLSLAVGYAGLDRMRVRLWPREDELPTLYHDATVAADEWLAARTASLELGELVDLLGSRAGELADVWNAWGRLRPVLLAAD